MPKSALPNPFIGSPRATPHPLPRIDVEKAIGWVEGKLGIQLAAGQQEAIRQACQQKMLVITGGPGVGKTTLVRSILEIFHRQEPEMRAGCADRQSGKTVGGNDGAEPPRPFIGSWSSIRPPASSSETSRTRLTGDLFVLDEVSMVDVVLGHQFFRAVPSNACVILVGDVDQLPSVGPGTVLADLISSGVVPVVRLTEIFRQAAESQIVTAAYAINQGRMPSLNTPEGLERLLLYRVRRARSHPRLDCAVGQGANSQAVQASIPRPDIQVLTPMNRSVLGARNLNQVLQEALNPSDGGPEIQRFGWTFRIGDRVIQTENDYNRDVFNGDLGMIEKINRIEQEMVVNFEGRQVEYDFADLDELSLAYVLSIHKSQGSEFPCVVIPMHTQHYMMLHRNLLYTAVTRGKRLVILVGTKKALGMAVRRQDTGRRYTALRKRLQEA